MEDSNYWTRLSRRRLSRRAILSAGATAALGGAAAVVVGCGGGGSNGSSNSGGTTAPRPTRGSGAPSSPRPGGSITWGRGVGVDGIDPHIDLTGLDLDTYFYSYLYSWLPGHEEVVLNDLAETLEQPDEVTFIFKLRHGVKCSPEGPAANLEMNSEDCKQSFIRRGTSITAPDKRFPHYIAGSGATTALEAALQTPDPYTFSFVMKEPFVPALREMANPTWAIVPTKVMQKYQSLSNNAYGSGPFMLEEFRGQERIVLKKNPNYFLSPRPWLDGMTQVVITENSSLLSAFKNGQHDVSGATLNKDDYDSLSQNQDYVTSKAPQLFYPVIHLKMKAPFNQLKVRQAMDLAINRDEILSVVESGEGNYNGPIQWAQTKWALPQAELRDFYRYDPEQAKALLKEVDMANGFSARMKLPKLTGPSVVGDIAVLVKDQLSKVGIKISLDEVELGAFIGSTLLPGNFQMAFFPNLPYDEPDRPLAFYHSLGVSGAGNWDNYSNPQLDQLINAQAREFDQAKRKDIIDQAQRMILKEHGPQLTLTGGMAYGAHWWYVHFPAELGQDPAKTVGPSGSDLWTEKG